MNGALPLLLPYAFISWPGDLFGPCTYIVRWHCSSVYWPCVELGDREIGVWCPTATKYCLIISETSLKSTLKYEWTDYSVSEDSVRVLSVPAFGVVINSRIVNEIFVWLKQAKLCCVFFFLFVFRNPVISACFSICQASSFWRLHKQAWWFRHCVRF